MARTTRSLRVATAAEAEGNARMGDLGHTVPRGRTPDRWRLPPADSGVRPPILPGELLGGGQRVG